MYHYIRDFKRCSYPAIKGLPVTEFREQLGYLSRNYTIISQETLLNAVINNERLPTKAAVLTFDDGYIDHFSNVLPILEEYKVKGLFFVPATPVLDKAVLPVNKIHFVMAVASHIKQLIKLLEIFINNHSPDPRVESISVYRSRFHHKAFFDDADTAYFKAMLQKGLPEDIRNCIIDQLFQSFITKDEASFASELYMNIDQLKELQHSGMYIGCHGYKHYWLDQLTRQEQDAEISKSMDFLRQVGTPLNNWMISYPYGSYNTDTLDLLKQYNCSIGFTTRVNIANLGSDNPLSLPRLDTNHLPKKTNASLNEWHEQA